MLLLIFTFGDRRKLLGVLTKNSQEPRWWKDVRVRSLNVGNHPALKIGTVKMPPAKSKIDSQKTNNHQSSTNQSIIIKSALNCTNHCFFIKTTVYYPSKEPYNAL